LIHDSRVPLDYSPRDLDVNTASTIRGLLRGYLAKGRVAELDHRCDGACEDYLLLVRVADKAARGGLLVDWLVASAVRGGALNRLQRIRAGLSSTQLRKAYLNLAAADAALEPVEDVVNRDRVWEEHAMGWHNRIRILRPSPNTAYHSLGDYFHAELRLIECDLAVRAFEKDHGRLSETLDALVPDYLQCLPNDPYTQRPFVYRRQPTGFLIYSTGPDQTDNGGIRNTQTRPPPTGEDIPLIAPNGC
jgi:hypothetical protein